MSYILKEIRTDSEHDRYTVTRELNSLYDLTVFSLKRDQADDEIKIYVHGFTTPSGFPAFDGGIHVHGLTCDPITAKELNDYIYNVSLKKQHGDIGLPRLIGARYHSSMDDVFTALDNDFAEDNIFPQGCERTAYFMPLTDILTEMRALEDEYEPTYVRYITPTLQRREFMVCETF